jgi:hypothetical protein
LATAKAWGVRHDIAPTDKTNKARIIKKWLSYREEGLLGRALKPEEAREVMDMARRLAAIVLMQPALDENYRCVKENTYPWPGEKKI